MPSSLSRLFAFVSVAVIAFPEAGAGQLLAPLGDLVLRAGDEIRVEIKDEVLLNGEYTVDQEGRVLLPLIGLKDVTHGPFSAVRRELLEAYAHELTEPVVILTPLMRISVLGEVRAPGVFPVDPSHTLADMIATAGGLTIEADTERISIIRAGIVFETTIDPRTGDLSLPMQSGDQIVVGRRSTLSQNLPIFLSALTSVAVAVVTSLLIR